MPPSLLSLPLELLALILDVIDARDDLLALALACKALHAQIVPEHLAYRELVLSDAHTATWDALARRPELASRVRALTLVNAPLAAPCAGAHTDRRMPGADWERYNRSDAERGGLVAKRVAGLPRLKSLSLQSGYDGAFDIPDEILDEILGCAGELECLSLDICGMTLHPGLMLYKMRDLRVLELGSGLISVDWWPSICNTVAQSPLLEVLELPSFESIHMLQTIPPLQPLPPLSRLLRFSCSYNCDIGNRGLRLFEFLDACPTLVELRFEGPMPRKRSTLPDLPNLRRIYGARSAPFALSYLHGKPPRSVPIEALECLTLNGHTAEEYVALDPERLRVLHVPDLGERGYGGLFRLAKMFPGVQELQLPTFGVPVPRFKWFRRNNGRTDQTYPKLASVAALFPQLRQVQTVEVRKSRVMRCAVLSWHQRLNLKTSPRRIDRRLFDEIEREVAVIRKRHPRLERVNGWSIREEKGRVELLNPVTLLATRTRPPLAKLVLTRDGYEAGYHRNLANRWSKPM